MYLFRLIVFVVLSRDSNTSQRVAPGTSFPRFYRFFAWEFILALILLNLPVWFSAPFTWHQLISWPLLILCIVPLVFGIRSLRSQGKPVSIATEPQLIGFEKTSRLLRAEFITTFDIRCIARYCS